MPVFTTSVTINNPNGSGSAQVTQGTPSGIQGRTITVTATPDPGFQFLGFDIVETPLQINSVLVGQRRDTVTEVCSQGELGTTGRLYFTLNPDGTPTSEISTDPAGNNQALDGYYSAGQLGGINKYYSLQNAILSGPLTCQTTTGGGTGQEGVAYTVTVLPAGFTLRTTETVNNPFTIDVRDVTGRTLVNRRIKFTSLNQNIFTVDENTGAITAIAPGTATIRFSAMSVNGLVAEAIGTARITVSTRT